MNSVKKRIEHFYNDKSWMDQVIEYSGMEKREFSELIACFFHDRSREGYTIQLPNWVNELDGEELLKKQDTIIKKRGWDTDMSLLGIIHLCYVAHSQYKKESQKHLLMNIENKLSGKKDGNIKLLDYGCGASSFSQLALTYDRVFCALVDVDPDILKFLSWFYKKKWPDHFKAQRVEILNDSISKRSRIRVDFRKIRGPFDIIILADVLEHMLDPLSVLLHFYSQLNNKGFFLVVYPKFIEGDWHTPEAFWMRKWCFLLLLLTCKRENKNYWFKRNELFVNTICFLFKLLHPFLVAKSKKFAYNYFMRNGKELVDVVRKRAKRKITLEGLLESVYD